MRSRDVLLLGAALLAACSSPKKIVGDDEPTLATLAGRRVAVQPDDGPPRDEARAVAAYRAFVAVAPASSPARAAAQRRLGDLELELAERRVGDGQAADFAASITQYQAWLAANPRAGDRDSVLYQLARAQEGAGQPDAALATLDRLVAAHPASAHRDEADFRRGELLFSARRWADAEAAYASVLQAGAGNPWLDRALYMQGWSRYRQGRWNDALESLFGVLDLKLSADTAQPLPRAEQELVDDSLRVTALALEQLQGAAAIDAHVQGERRRGYAWRVYEQLAALYQRQGRMRDAGDTYQRLARQQPLSPRAAWARLQVVALHDAAGFTQQALQARRDFVLAHAPGSDWARAQATVDNDVSTAWQQQADLLAQHHHAQVQRTKQADEVDAALRWYRLAIEHGSEAGRGQRRFLMAELLTDAGRDADALAAHQQVAYGPASEGPDTGRRADAAYAALLSRDRLLAARAAAPGDQVAAAQRFARAFDGDARTPAVLVRAAELQWAQQQADAARTLAQQVLQRPDAAADTRRRAHAVLGDVALRSGDAGAAEQAYAQELALLPADDTAGRQRAGDRLAAAIYRQAEADRAAGRSADAARHFARVAAQLPASSAAPAALYDGALQLIALKDWAGATQALETLRSRHPQHKLAADAVPQLALAYAESGRPGDAATQLERWAATLPDADAARAARWQAAGLYDRAGDSARALAIHLRAQQDPASPLPQVVQSRWRLAEQARVHKRGRDEEQWLRSLRQADAAGGSARTEATRTLSARAALRLAEPLLQAYGQVALAEPLKASLARKQARFDAVQAAYADAAATGSAAGQALATAASADLYADFGRAVLASQRPRGLKKADVESYTVLLQEQAQPFEDKAADLHRANAERTKQGQWDEGVRASYAALRSLRPLRWDKHEAAPPDDGSAATRALRQALADREAGRFVDARRTLEGLLAADPSHQAARLNLAILLDLYLHDAAGALPHYQALAPSPALPALPRWIAELQTRAGRPALAAMPEVRR